MEKRTYEAINEKIRTGEVVVVSAEEIVDMVKAKGIDEVFEQVDVVTTATFGPMCSSGAFLNFGHSDPPIRMEKITLNNVPVSGGLAAVDTFIGATEESITEGYEYGGAHVIYDLLRGKEVELHATGKGTDCYPNQEIRRKLRLEDLNEAYLYNPRNCYQNYNAAINTSNEHKFTYMGMLKKNRGNVNYATTGTLSPLLNDPYYRTIGMGTRIWFAGTQGYVAWEGTQFNSATHRDENGIPLGGGATLALVGNLKEMDPEYIRPAVFEGYGTSFSVGVGIPIPVLDKELLKQLAVSNDELFQNVVDYSVPRRSKPVVARVSYSELRSGSVEIDGKKIKTAPTSSLKKAREIAEKLKQAIKDGEFYLQEPIKIFTHNSSTKGMRE
ncbi:MAG: homocysteine biosynthesis protein [Clostridia bacterium]|nr:homocysteine biosynthesis protein [Clostridia bacterium]